MNLVGVAARAVLLPLDALGVQAAILRGEVVAILTIVASQNDFISWHLLLRSPQLLNDLGYYTSADGTAALSNGEAKSLVHRDRSD